MSVYSHPRLSSLICLQQFVPLRDLPIDYQDALIHYMSVDGAGWAVADDWKDWRWGEGTRPELRSEVIADIAKFRPRFIEAYGDQEFGFGSLPFNTLIDCVNGDSVFLKENRKYTVGDRSRTLDYSIPTWPVILSDFHDETLQDGWNRFYEYCVRKMDVPVTWFVY